MSLLDKASLIVTPNGYSENTIYSVIPSSGAGDLVFSRATDAWRTNSQGLVQRTPWNLLQYSEQFDASGVWVKSNAGVGSVPVVTSNFAIAPNGTLTADRVQCSNVGGSGSEANYSLVIQSNVPLRTTGTVSIYLKSLTGATQNVLVYWSGGQGTVFQVTPQWQRFILPNASATITGDGVVFGTRGGSAFYSGGDAVIDIAVWGAQVNEGLSALDYFTTTNRQNVPRIDYSLGGCPTLLMEPQRTNIVLRSEEFDNASWSKSITTVTANSSTSPSGIQNADNISFTTTGSYIRQLLNTASATTYTASVYVKKSSTTGNNLFKFYYNNNSLSPNDGAFSSIIDLTNLTISTSVGGTVGTGRPTILSSQLINAGNDWYRAIVSFTTGTSAGSATSEIGFQTSVVVNFEAWGAQLEAGAYPTSYIPTTTASVTRNADLATKLGISSLLGQTEGTVFYEMSIPQPLGLGNQVFSHIANDAGSFFYYAYVNNTGNIVFDIYAASGIYTFTLITSTPMVVGRNRVALVYKAGAYKVFLNGVLVATSTNSTPITNTLSRLTLTVNVTPIYYYEFAAFKSALSDSELELLTGNYFDSYAKMAAFYNYTLQ